MDHHPVAYENVGLGSALPVHTNSSEPIASPSPSPTATTDSSSTESHHKKEPASHPVPVYTPEPSSANAPTGITRQTSTMGGLLNRISTTRSRHSGRQADDDDNDSVSSFDRAVSRRSAAAAEGAWSLEGVMKSNKAIDERDGRKPRRLDLMWKGLSVRGVGADAVFADDLGS